MVSGNPLKGCSDYSLLNLVVDVDVHVDVDVIDSHSTDFVRDHVHENVHVHGKGTAGTAEPLEVHRHGPWAVV